MRRGDDRNRLTVGHEPWQTALEPGESVAVRGVCLTVAACRADSFTCDVLDETLCRTSLGELAAGSPLNLERAMQAGDRFGGHIVSGHIDGVGRVTGVEKRGADRELTVRAGGELAAGMVPKGSVACDGVSLTISVLSEDSFAVRIIPFTWENTNLGRMQVGDPVNIETDMLGKYVRRAMAASAPRPGVDMDTLRRAGFA